MIRFIKRLCIGILVIGILDLCLGLLLEKFYFEQSSGFQYRTTYSIEETDQEVLVFGSSRANHHYIPVLIEKIMGKTCYNTGREGQFIFYQTAVLAATLERYIPQIVLYDFSGSFAYNEGDYDKLSALLPYYDRHEAIRDVVNLRSPYEPVKNISHIYPYNSLLINILNGNSSFTKSEDDDNGYLPLTETWPEEIAPRELSRHYVSDERKIEKFRKFITLSKQNNIDLFVIFSPVFYSFESDFSMRLCERICKEEKVPFLNFSRTPALMDKRFFSDPDHLNDEGSRRFTEMVADTVRLIRQNRRNL